MNKQDPYGWVQWYCRFYKGRRTPDDKRQIKRWLAFSGPKGRFKRRLVNMIKKKKTKYNDYKISPVIRQGLQHWAYRLVPSDVRKKPVKKRNFGKWSLKYKRSINCKRPKGFSQKQYCKRKRKFGKKTFLYNPNNPKTSFDVYINKNPKDTIPIKYTTIKDVQNTIRKLERLYKAKKYPHTRIWKVGMILKVRLEAMVKHTGKKKTHFKHSKNYFHFLGQRTTKKEPERRKMVFKFNKTYRKVKKVKRRRRKFGTQRALEFRKASYEDLKRLGLPDGLVRKILLMSHMNLSPQLGASIRQLPRLRTPQENAQIVREMLENGQNVIAPFINLRGANLAQLVLGDAVLRGANLHNADLRGAHLYGVNLQGANLKGANLRRADLTDGNLQGANLKGANLVNSELGANLKGANFQGANLDYCWITGADLRETNLDNAFSLHMVRYNNQTRFPVGFDPTTRELPPDFGRIKQMINVDNFYHASHLL